MCQYSSRRAVPDEYTWDLTRLFDCEQDWEAEYEEVRDEVAEFEANTDEDIGDADALRAALRRTASLSRRVERLETYAQLRRDTDGTDDAYERANRVRTLASELERATDRLESAIRELGRDRIRSMIDANPELQPYERYFDSLLRRAQFAQSPAVESALTTAEDIAETPAELYRLLVNADLDFPAVETPDGESVRVTPSNFTRVLGNPNRAFRRDAYRSFYSTLSSVERTLAGAYANSVEANVRLARAHGFETVRELECFESDVPTDVHETLLRTLRSNTDLLARHCELKRERIGADSLRNWDLPVSLADGEPPEIPYDEACELLHSAVEPLGAEYQRRLKDGLDSGWVDAYETPEKASRSYCRDTYDDGPFVSLNYANDLTSLYTFAHELGHALHATYKNDDQPYRYAQIDNFVAEVASMVHEALLTHHLLTTVDDSAFRRHVRNEYLERFRSILFRQAMLADFEHRVHRTVESGDALSLGTLDDTFREVKTDYYSVVEPDEYVGRGWMRVPHFFRQYYVYKYATGFSAAVTLAADIAEGDEAVATRYRRFLGRGANGSPVELLRDAGVDVTDSSVFESALDVYGQHLQELSSESRRPKT